MASDDDISVDRGASQPPLPPHPQASDDAELHTVSDSANCAENYYKNEGSSLKMLVAMCHGLRDGDGDESLVIDLTANPWKSLPVMQIRPSREFYAKEVLRRAGNLMAANSMRQQKGMMAATKGTTTTTITTTTEEDDGVGNCDNGGERDDEENNCRCNNKP
jgi:hypothetical protein